ncbi:MAG: phosphatidate cytidylyltransferase [Corynebacterium sp.]|nr:phosphatidate cytidylyltransferase [Corynebacterium sp.]
MRALEVHPKNKPGRNVPQAITVGVFLGAIVLTGIFVGPVLWYPIVAAAMALASWEVHRRLAEHGYLISLSIQLFGGQIIIWASWPWGLQGMVTGYSFTVLVILFSRLFRNGRHVAPRNYLRDATMAIFILTWIPLCGSFAAMLSVIDREGISGTMFVLTFMLCVVASDNGGFIAGVTFGSHAMAPAISPSKSWEGVVGSLVLTGVVACLSAHFLLAAPWWSGLVLAPLMVAAATLGDLVESQFKREMGIKDMSRMLPGHGGIMDRLDGMLPTAAVTWLLLTLIAQVMP